jgi:RNA polymerase sigma-70 factor (ECF subfamily)
MDPRLAVRVDPSDVVQDTLIEAARRLSDFLRQEAIPFYPWLRNLAAERLIQLQRFHIRAKRRSVNREERGPSHLSDASAAKLASYILSGHHDPLSRLHKAEMLQRVRAALDELPERDREVLIFRYLEQLSIAETAAVLNVNNAVVKMRHLRALERLRALLDDGFSDR